MDDHNRRPVQKQVQNVNVFAGFAGTAIAVDVCNALFGNHRLRRLKIRHRSIMLDRTHKSRVLCEPTTIDLISSPNK